MDNETDIEKLKSFLAALQNADIIDNSISQKNSSCKNLSKVNKRKRYIPERPNKTVLDDDRKEKLETIENALVQNGQINCLLIKMESSLMKYILQCTKEKILINRKIAELKTSGSKIRKEYTFLYRGKVSSLHKVCISPYFKDVNGFGPMPNEDVQERKCLSYLDSFDRIKTKPWNNEQKRALEKAILTIELEEKGMLTKDNPINHLKGMHPLGVKQYLVEEVGDKVEEYDWLKLSAYYLQGARSAHECRAVWFNYLHPKFKKALWSEQEANKLSMIAEQNHYSNWDKIAEELGTSRSAFQCIGYYSITLYDLSNVPWTQTEYEHLKTIVDHLRFGSYIAWAKVAYFMDGRLAAESYRKWQKQFAGLKKGKFSKEEDMLLVVGLRKFGPKWTDIAEYLPNRNSVQIRGRIHVLKGREVVKAPWTPEDDDLLHDLVKKYGHGNWAKMSQHFLHRSAGQLRSRYRSLKNKEDNESVGPYNQSVKTPNLHELWEAAVSLMKRKAGKNSLKECEDHNAAIMDELSKVLKQSRKRGRKIGQVNDSSIQRLFHNYFFVSYGQQGGRGKDKCTADMIPTLSYYLVLALRIFDARLFIPWEMHSILEDCVIPEIDKDIAAYLNSKKELIRGKSRYIRFVKPEETLWRKYGASLLQAYELRNRDNFASKRNVHIPSNHATLIGLRTMLLHLRNLKAQKNGITVQKISTDAESDSNPSTSTSREMSESSLSILPGESSCIASTSSSVVMLPLAYRITSYVPVKSSVAYKPTIISNHPSSTVVNPSGVGAINAISTRYSPCVLSASGITPIFIPSDRSTSNASPSTKSSGVTVLSTSPESETFYAPTTKEMYNNAAALFRQRITMLFVWSGLVSTSYPSQKEKTCVVFKKEKQDRLPKKRGRKKKVGGTTNKGNTEKKQKPKRPYVKSGKYISQAKPSETLRKSSRKKIMTSQ